MWCPADANDGRQRHRRILRRRFPRHPRFERAPGDVGTARERSTRPGLVLEERNRISSVRLGIHLIRDRAPNHGYDYHLLSGALAGDVLARSCGAGNIVYHPSSHTDRLDPGHDMGTGRLQARKRRVSRTRFLGVSRHDGDRQASSVSMLSSGHLLRRDEGRPRGAAIEITIEARSRRHHLESAHREVDA